MQNYVDAGLCQKQYEKVKLHVTVINTKYRREEEPSSTVSTLRLKQQRETFSAKDILSSYHDYNFGQANIDKIHLSISGAKKDSSGYYQSADIIDLTA